MLRQRDEPFLEQRFSLEVFLQCRRQTPDEEIEGSLPQGALLLSHITQEIRLNMNSWMFTAQSVDRASPLKVRGGPCSFGG